MASASADIPPTVQDEDEDNDDENDDDDVAQPFTFGGEAEGLSSSEEQDPPTEATKAPTKARVSVRAASAVLKKRKPYPKHPVGLKRKRYSNEVYSAIAKADYEELATMAKVFEMSLKTAQNIWRRIKKSGEARDHRQDHNGGPKDYYAGKVKAR